MTDLHLNFINGRELYEFLDTVADHSPDAVLVGGDTGQANDFALYLQEMADVLPCPIYFVLGNHDFYGSSLAAVRARAAAIADGARLCWLTRAGIVELSPTICLIGHDGWNDGRLGNFASSSVQLNDYALIEDLAGLDSEDRLRMLNRLGDAAAEHFERILPRALQRFQQVVLLTHVPPFREGCWHEGRISDDEWLPYMTCRAVADVLVRIMRQHSERQLTVLCGHTHSSGEARPLDNLHVLTGGATYGSPAVARILELP